MHKRLATLLSPLFVCLALSPALANPFETAEYYKLNGLDTINASAAYLRGFTGKGVTVGYADDSAFPEHQEFWNRYFTVLLTQAADPDDDHGVHISGIIAANRDGKEMHGVAFDSGLVSSISPDGSYADALARFDDFPEVRILSNSWGFDIFLSNMCINCPDPTPAQEENINLETLENALPVMKRQIEARDVLYLFAAGNEGNTSPIHPAGFPTTLLGGTLNAVQGLPGQQIIAPEDMDVGKVLANNIISVMAYDAHAMRTWGTDSPAFVATSTNLADGATEYSLMAPGVDIYSTATSSTRSYQLMDGTSMATPVVAGVAALVQQAFPYMGGKQIGDVLLSTTMQPKTASTMQPGTTDFEIPPFLVLRQSYPQDQSFPFLLVYTDLADAASYVFKPGEHEYLEEKLMIDGTTLDALLDGSFLFSDPEYYLQLTPEAYAALFGQGLVDAGRAVLGPGYFNANRLNPDKDIIATANDYNYFKTVGTTLGKNYGDYAMYTVDTKGYDSLFGNDIGQQKVNVAPGHWLHSLNNLDVGFRKQGAGILYMSGANTYQGPTIVEGGVVSLLGSSSSLASDVWVESQGWFAGNGKVKANILSRGGLVPGLMHQAGTALTVTGNVHHTGILGLVVNNQGAANAFTAQNITFTSSMSLLVASDNGAPLRPGLTFGNTVATAHNTLSSAPSYSFDPSPFLHYTLTQSGSSMILGLQTHPLTALNAGLPWQSSQVATALEQRFQQLQGLGQQRDLDILYNLSEGEFRDALGQLRGDVHGATLASSPMNSAFRREMGARHFASGLPSSRNAAPASGDDEAGSVFMWANPFYDYSHTSGNASFNQPASNTNTFGLAAGAEWQTASPWLKLGFIVGGSYSTTESGTREQAEITDFGIAPYAVVQADRLRLSAYAMASLQHYDTERSLDIGSHVRENLESDFAGHTLGAGGVVSFNVLPASINQWELAPYAGIDYWYQYQESRTESGHRTFALAIDSATSHRTDLEAGISTLWKMTDTAEAFARVGYRRILHGDAPTTTARISGSNGPSFDLVSPEQDKNSITYGLGANLHIVDNWSFAAEITGRQARDSNSLGLSFNLGYQW